MTEAIFHSEIQCDIFQSVVKWNMLHRQNHSFSDIQNRLQPRTRQDVQTAAR